MALDKLVDSAQLDSDLASVANAIRAKSGGAGQLAFPAGFVSEIGNISGGGGGSGDPVYGLISEHTVTEEVSTITLPIPALALEDHRVFVELDNLAHSTDYLYPTIDNATKSGPYLKQASVENALLQMFFVESKTVDGKEFRGGFGFSSSVTGGGGGTVLTLQNFTPGSVVLALYKAASVFTGGTVRLYGRVS